MKIPQSQGILFGHSVKKQELTPDGIKIEQCSLGLMRQMQRLCSRAVWLPHAGRYYSCFATYNGEIIGLIYLATGVFSLKARDDLLKIPKDPKEKGQALLSYPDLAICVGVQPLAWYWNLGKLCAMIATGLREEWQTAAEKELKGIVTTSYWGRSSQYNRVYQHIGRTKGFGSLHVPDEEIYRMEAFLRNKGVVIKQKTSYRMKVIQEYWKRQMAWRPGLVSRKVRHGQIRDIYYHAVDKRPMTEIIRAWFDRWGEPRWQRTRELTAPYQDGITNIGVK